MLFVSAPNPLGITDAYWQVGCVNELGCSMVMVAFPSQPQSIMLYAKATLLRRKRLEVKAGICRPDGLVPAISHDASLRRWLGLRNGMFQALEEA